MKKSIFIIIFLSFLFLGNPVYSKEYSQQTLDKYIEKISNKFSRTCCVLLNLVFLKRCYCFAIGETNKEFKNNQMNGLIENSLIKENIVSNLEISCQVYDFPLDNLDKLKIS